MKQTTRIALGLMLALLAIAPIAHASGQPIQASNFSYRSTGVTFANLNIECGTNGVAPQPPGCTSQIDGNAIYCKDCTAASVCIGGGNGAWAFHQGGVWNCQPGGPSPPFSGSASSIAGLGAGAIIAGFGNVQHVINLEGYQCHANGVICQGDASISSSSQTLSCPNSQPFTPGMVGESAVVFGAGVAAAALSTTIQSYTSASSVNLTLAAGTSVGPVYAVFGTDDQACAKAALAAAAAQGGAMIKFQPGKNYFFKNFDTSGQGCGGNSTILCDGTPTLNNVIWDLNGGAIMTATGIGATLFESGGLSVPTPNLPINNATRGALKVFTSTAGNAALVCVNGFGLKCPIRLDNTSSGTPRTGSTNYGIATNASTGEVDLLYPLAKNFNTGTPQIIDESATVTYNHGVIDSQGSGAIYIGQNDHFQIAQNVIGMKRLGLHLYAMHSSADIGVFWNNVNFSEEAFNVFTGSSNHGPWIGGGNAGSAHAFDHQNFVSMTPASGVTAMAMTEGGEDWNAVNNFVGLNGAGSGDIAINCGDSLDSVVMGNIIATDGPNFTFGNGAAATNCVAQGNTFKDNGSVTGGGFGDKFIGNIFYAPTSTPVQFNFGTVAPEDYEDNRGTFGACNQDIFNMIGSNTTAVLSLVMQSKITGNIINCASGTYHLANIADPGTSCTTCLLLITGNQALGGTASFAYQSGAAADATCTANVTPLSCCTGVGTGTCAGAAVDLPNRTVALNPGLPQYNCQSDQTLSGGSGSWFNACISPQSKCTAVDITTSSNACTVGQPPGNGSLSLTGTGTDVCRVSC